VRHFQATSFKQGFAISRRNTSEICISLPALLTRGRKSRWGQFSAKKRKTRKSPINVASNPLPESPVSLRHGRVVPTSFSIAAPAARRIRVHSRKTTSATVSVKRRNSGVTSGCLLSPKADTPSLWPATCRRDDVMHDGSRGPSADDAGIQAQASKPLAAANDNEGLADSRRLVCGLLRNDAHLPEVSQRRWRHDVASSARRQR
jgi:hypothetical protein